MDPRRGKTANLDVHDPVLNLRLVRMTVLRLSSEITYLKALHYLAYVPRKPPLGHLAHQTTVLLAYPSTMVASISTIDGNSCLDMLRSGWVQYTTTIDQRIRT